MKRRFLALFLAGVMAATALTACGGKKDKEVKESKTEQSDNKKSDMEKDSMEKGSMDQTSEENVGSEAAASESGEMSGDQVKAGLKERFTLAYYGTDEKDTDIYWAVAPDVTSGMILTMSADKSESVFIIGGIEQVDEEWLKLKDEKTGMEVKVKIEKVDENDPSKGIKMTTEGGNVAVLLGMPADKVIDRMFEVFGE